MLASWLSELAGNASKLALASASEEKEMHGYEYERHMIERKKRPVSFWIAWIWAYLLTAAYVTILLHL